MAMERWVPLRVSRANRGFFDPTWEVGDDWNDFFQPRHVSFRDDYSSQLSKSQHKLEKKMARMQEDMDRFFSNALNAYTLAPRSRSLTRDLSPLRDYSPSRDLMALPRPRSPMSRHHLRLHASEASRMTSEGASNGSRFLTASNLSPLALRAAEELTVEHPVVVDSNGIKKLELNFDVRAFKPDEIQVKTKDNQFIEVHASHEEKSETGLVKREYHRMFSIPTDTDTSRMKSLLSPEGVLTIAAPMRTQPKAIASGGQGQPTSIAISHE